MSYSEQKTFVGVMNNESIKTVEMNRGNVSKEYRREEETNATFEGSSFETRIQILFTISVFYQDQINLNHSGLQQASCGSYHHIFNYKD